VPQGKTTSKLCFVSSA